MPDILEAPPTSKPPTDRLVTAEELMRHPEWGPCELIRGKVVPVCRPNAQHGFLMSEVGGEIRNFVRPRHLGRVITGDSGVFLEHDPDTVRGPDVYFISAARMPLNGIPPTFQEVAPDLCVEIVSPNDKMWKLKEKVAEFLKFGVKLVWVLHPKTRNARVYRADKSIELISSSGVLSGEDVLPGFTLSLKELFAPLR